MSDLLYHLRLERERVAIVLAPRDQTSLLETGTSINVVLFFGIVVGGLLLLGKEGRRHERLRVACVLLLIWILGWNKLSLLELPVFILVDLHISSPRLEGIDLLGGSLLFL